MIYEIYIATSPSGKCYIGLTSNFTRRKRDHIYKAFHMSSTNIKFLTRFKAAIRKYGEEKIVWQVIDSAKDIETAKELERRYVLHFNSHHKGYNMTDGGDSAGNIRIFWTKDKTLLEALKYKTLNEWKDTSKGSYDAARRYRKEDELFYQNCITHMPQMNKWTIEKLKEETLKYNNMNAFKKACPNGYSAFRYKDKEIISELTSHMIRINHDTYTKEELLLEAKKYTSKARWKERSESTYKKAIVDKQFFLKCTEHMIKK